MNLNNVFLFIATELEWVGQPKNDKAGATIFGITKRWYPEEYQRLYDIMFGSLDRKIYPSIENIGASALRVIYESKKNELYAAIIEIYSEIYNNNVPKWLKYPTNVFFFDFAFNAHPKWARKTLQITINNFLPMNKQIKVDGIIGKKTTSAYKKVTRFDFKKKFAWMYMVNREKWYTHNKQRQLRCSWVNRCGRLEKFVLMGRAK